MDLLTREQLEDRLAALHQVSLELVRDLSPELVLERIVNLARDQVDASYAALGVVDEHGELIKFIPVGMTPEEVRKTGNAPVGLGMIGALSKLQRTIRVADLSQSPHSAGFPPGHPLMESFLGVPIMLGETPLGQIYLTNKIGHSEFTAADERVIETLAAYAAVAIYNARMYENLRQHDHALSQRNEDLALLNDVAESLSSTLDTDQILDKTLNRVLAYLEVEAGEIYLINETAQELQLALHTGQPGLPFLTSERIRIGKDLIGKVALSGELKVSHDLETDICNLNPAMKEAGLECLVCIPLTARGKVVGVMSIAAHGERQFDAREQNLLHAIGAWAGITIENSQLHSQSRRLAIMEERERIGMDLHDGIIQTIYGVGLALEYARDTLQEDPQESRKKIEQALSGLNKTVRDIRAYILDLRPRQFAGDDLRHGLGRLVEEFRANTLSEAALITTANGISSLPATHGIALFHICQEALANSAKHSRASRTTVHLWTTPDRVLLEVSDNGRGFNLRKTNITLGHGLSNMHIRARKVGGDVEITSAPQAGTTVLAWVPRRAK